MANLLDEIAARVAEFNDRQAQMGWFESARYDDGTSVAEVAIIHEFGAPGASIPARPFMRPTVAEHKGEWAKQLAEGAKAVIKGVVTADAVLDAVGVLGASQMQYQIATMTNPPLSPVTLLLRKWRREGRTITGKTVGEAAAMIASSENVDLSGVPTDPLRDTGYLLATLTSVVGKPL